MSNVVETAVETVSEAAEAVAPVVAEVTKGLSTKHKLLIAGVVALAAGTTFVGVSLARRAKKKAQAEQVVEEAEEFLASTREESVSEEEPKPANPKNQKFTKPRQN